MNNMLVKNGQRNRRRLFCLGARLVLGLVFVYASVDKIVHPESFAEMVHNYRLLPDIMVNLTAIVLPWLELLLGLFLMSGLWLPGASFLGMLLMALFFGAIAFNAFRGLDIRCGCFSVSENNLPQAHMAWYLLRDLAIFMLALYLFCCVLKTARTSDDRPGK